LTVDRAIRRATEGDPALLVAGPDAVFGRRAGLVEVPGEQQRPGEQAGRPGHLPWASGRHGEAGRGGQQLGRLDVPADIRPVHSADPVDAGAESRVRRRRRQGGGLGERALGRRVPAGLQVDERQLAQDVGGQHRAAGAAGGRERPVQDHRPLAVETAHGVHERAAERPQRVGEQHRVRRPLRLLRSPPQRLHPGVHGTGVQGGAAGPEKCGGGHRGADADARGRRRRAGGGPGGRRHSQALPVERPLAQRQVCRRPGVVPGRGQHPKEQLLRLLVERFEGGRPAGRDHGGLGVADREQPQGGLAQLGHRPGAALTAGEQQPGVEARAAPQVHTGK
jgi:hypothetical protein